MRYLLPVLLAVSVAAQVAPCHAQFAPPLGARPEVAGARTQMATLASIHLSGHSGDWQVAWLTPLRARIIAWRPQLITIENLSGSQCEMMRALPGRYAETYDTYCTDATPFQRSLKLTQAEAEARAEQQLATWPRTPTPAQRRELAMLFLAAGDFGSAMVQWLRLPPAERRAGDTLSERAVKHLTRSSGTMNESIDVAAEVAASVGLDRLHAVDDHTSDAIFSMQDPAFEPWQQARYEAIVPSPQLVQQSEVEKHVHDGESLLAYYRVINAAHANDDTIQLDFGGALTDPHSKRFGRQYVGWWETRNLRMAANIRGAISRTPGVRVLNIVGASHKPWYDQWARQMSDVEVVDVAAVLGP
ncbi:DUF5694 domain-containing protein [Aerolutibacter daejeonensis]|uniref:DUF5694 domain-containing protein n=1 Tax=Aerolutibacter daejeonensis TaxID=346181 RepID=UPI0012EB99D3|nr:DUF5694 domain-containing protein [Lysobacter daejeonensis]